jgi:hypothetical protein
MIFFRLLILFLMFTNCVKPEHGAHGNSSSKTHFSDIPVFLSATPERISFINIQDINKSLIVSCTPFVGYSKNNTELAEYFLPWGRSILYASGDYDYFSILCDRVMRRDIDATVFGIHDQQFQSIFKITPEVRLCGVGFIGQYIFSHNNNNTPRWSIRCATPIYNKKHVISIKESIKNSSSSSIVNNKQQTIADALSAEELKYSRWNFDSHGMSKTGIGDIECNIVFNYTVSDRCSSEGYLGLIFPTHSLQESKKNKATYIFEPSIGNGGYFGLQYGTNISIIANENLDSVFQFVLATNTLYGFSKKQFRTFDLKDKPWSRYIPVYLNFTPYTPGLGQKPQNANVEPVSNVLTLAADVSPNFSTTATAEFMYHKDWYSLSVGYSLYARQSESIMIKDQYPQIVIKSANQSALDNVINPQRTITFQYINEDITVTQDSERSRSQLFAGIIKNCDIDKTSATHPGVLTGTLYGKLLFTVDSDSEAAFGLGGSYTFSHTNTAIEYAKGWLFLTVGF